MAYNRSRSPPGRNRRPASDRRHGYSNRQDGYSDRRVAYSHRQDRYSDSRSPSPPMLRPRIRDDEPEAPHGYSDRRGAYSHRQDRYSDRRSPSPPKLRPKARKDEQEAPSDYSDRRGAYSHRQDRYSDRQSPSPPKLRPKVREDEPEAPMDPQKEFFEWAKSQRHKDTWLLTGRVLVDPECSRGQRVLSARGSEMLLEGFNTSETKVIELRAEVQLLRGKVSPPLRKTEGDEKTNPSDEELRNGRKTVITKIFVLDGSQAIPAEVNSEKKVFSPTLIIRGILEHTEGSKDQEKASERTKQSLFVPPNWPGDYQAIAFMAPPQLLG